MEPSILRANLEALLFVSEEPQSLMRLAEAIPDVSRDEVQQALAVLAEEYKDSRYGLDLVEVAGGFQVCTKPDYADSINRLFERRRKRTLSKPALETLAIVAYKQPITRAEMEAIRGVNVDGAIHTLLERRLIKIGGRKEVPGKPFFYRTTKSFLQYFGLKSLSELPKVDDIAQGLKPLHDQQLEQESPQQPELWSGMEEEPISNVFHDEVIPSSSEEEEFREEQFD